MVEIEMAVIGCLLIWFEEMYDTMQQLDESDFAFPQCKEIFNVMVKQPKNADRTIILSELSEDAKVCAIRATEAYVVSKASFNSYLIKLKQNSNSRKIKEQLYAAIVDDNAVITADDLLRIAEAEKNTVLEGFAEKAKSQLKGFADRATADVKKIKTGFSGLDSVIGGLRVPAVSIVGALPSTGKTSFALNITHTQLLSNTKTVIFSLEMSTDMIYERLASIFLEFDYQLFNTRKFTSKDKQDLRRFQDMLECLDLYVFDDIYDVETQNLIVSQIKPDFVVVDYVQKVTSKNKKESRRTEVEYVSGQYKQMALKNDCHIMLLSQMTRGSDSNLTMRNLKESGALEADGDYVMILDRPYVHKKGDHEPSETTLLIDKNKFGSTGIKMMSFEGKYQKFYEVMPYADNTDIGKT